MTEAQEREERAKLGYEKYGHGSSKEGDGSGLTVFKGFFTAKERKRLIRYTLKCLKETTPVPDPYVNFSFNYGGEIKEIFEERLKDLKSEDFTAFSDYDITRVRIWCGKGGGMTVSHYDAGSVVVFSTQLIGHKRWFTRRAGIDVLWRTIPNIPFLMKVPHYFKYDQFWTQQRDQLDPGDLLTMPEFTYHTVTYQTDAISIDLVARKKGFRLAKLRHFWPACKANWYPRPNLFNTIVHYLLQPVCFLFALYDPIATLKAHASGTGKFNKVAMKKNQAATVAMIPWIEEEYSKIPIDID